MMKKLASFILLAGGVWSGAALAQSQSQIASEISTMLAPNTRGAITAANMQQVLSDLNNGKAPVASPTFTGLVQAPTLSTIDLSATPTGSYGSLTVQNSTTTASGVLGPQQPPSYFSADGVRSTMVVPPTATAQTTSSFGFYVLNNGTKNAAGIFGTSVCAFDGCSVWGENPTVIDAPVNGVATSGANRRLIIGEGDISVTSPNTTVTGWSLLGSSLAQPAYADGFVIGGLNANNPSQYKWTHGFVVNDGTAGIGYLTGASATTGSSVGGIPNYLNYRDAGGLVRAVSYNASSAGGFNIGGTAAANGVTIQPAVAGQFPIIQSYGSDANPGLTLQAQGSGQVVTQSFLNANKGLYVSSSAQFNAPVRMQVTTVAGLPACAAGISDSIAAVSDATAPTYRGALTGGGTVRTLVYCDGTSWTAH